MSTVVNVTEYASPGEIEQVSLAGRVVRLSLADLQVAMTVVVRPKLDMKPNVRCGRISAIERRYFL